jgi:YegS/Rv2252/BmrU family lipid kinase
LRRRILIIVNPAAGRSRQYRRRLDEIIAALESRGCKVVVRRAALHGDAERLAREAEPEFEAIVAAGGDGTVNAVANGLAENPRDLALLPFGTANVLAREIGLPRRSEALAALIAATPARPIWPARIGDRLFLTVAGAGFDAEVVAAVDPRLKRRIGRFAFLWGILVQLVRHRPAELSIRADGVAHRATAVIATKGRLYAGPFVIAPVGNLAEPVIDFVLFHDTGRIAVLRYLCALLLGRIARLRSVTLLRARSVAVSAAEVVPVQADGEIVGQLPATIAVALHPIPLIRP